MKKRSLLHMVIATIITIVMLLFSVPYLLFGIARIVALGEVDNLIFLLPTPIAATVIYAVWLLVRSYPEKFRAFYIILGMILGATFCALVVVNLNPCSGLQCIGNGIMALFALGTGLAATFFVALYYLIQVKAQGSNSKKMKMK